jgi:hypothetical protein
LSLHRDHNAAINILKPGTGAVFSDARQLCCGVVHYDKKTAPFDAVLRVEFGFKGN